jgi:hypothetical protein
MYLMLRPVRGCTPPLRAPAGAARTTGRRASAEITILECHIDLLLFLDAVLF